MEGHAAGRIAHAFRASRAQGRQDGRFGRRHRNGHPALRARERLRSVRLGCKQPGQSAGGSGIGLSLVRSVVQLHGEDAHYTDAAQEPGCWHLARRRGDEVAFMRSRGLTALSRRMPKIVGAESHASRVGKRVDKRRLPGAEGDRFQRSFSWRNLPREHRLATANPGPRLADEGTVRRANFVGAVWTESSPAADCPIWHAPCLSGGVQNWGEPRGVNLPDRRFHHAAVSRLWPDVVYSSTPA